MLNSKVFDESTDLLIVSYPASARLLTSKVKAAWYKALSGYTSQDFLAGLCEAKSHCMYQMPTLPDIENRIKVQIKLRENEEFKTGQKKHEQLKHEKSNWNSIQNANTLRSDSATVKSIKRDIFEVLQSGEVLPYKFLALAEKYKNVNNSEGRGTMGDCFSSIAKRMAQDRETRGLKGMMQQPKEKSRVELLRAFNAEKTNKVENEV